MDAGRTTTESFARRFFLAAIAVYGTAAGLLSGLVVGFPPSFSRCFNKASPAATEGVFSVIPHDPPDPAYESPMMIKRLEDSTMISLTGRNSNTKLFTIM